jgi:hypothetical protein
MQLMSEVAGYTSIEEVQAHVQSGADQMTTAGTILRGHAEQGLYACDAMVGAEGSLESASRYDQMANEAEAAAQAAANAGEDDSSHSSNAARYRALAQEHRETAQGQVNSASDVMGIFLGGAQSSQENAEQANGMLHRAFAGSNSSNSTVQSTVEDVLSAAAAVPGAIGSVITKINAGLDAVKGVISPETVREGGNFFKTSVEEARDDAGARAIAVGAAAVTAAALL